MEYFEIAILSVGCLLVGIYVGWKSREAYAVMVLDSLVSSLEDDEQAAPVPINIEEHNGIYFVYSKEDHTFMAQGKTRTELESNLLERYPNKSFAASTENLTAVGFK